MIEKWRKSLDKGGAFGTLLTDPSKALNCLSHELLVAKLHAYELDIPSLKLLYSYLTKRKQRVKLNGTYRSWSKIIFGVLQDSILGPLLFNIFLCHNLLKAYPEKLHLLTNSAQEIEINIPYRKKKSA